MKKLSSVTISGGLTVDQATTLSGVVSVGGIGTGAYTSVLVRNSSNQMLYRNFSDFVNDISGSLNLSGYVPTSRTLTINGTTYDLSADRTWTISTVDYTSRLQHQVKAGVAINKGQAVYVTSADGTNMIVGLASNASEATSSKTMGLLDATVSTNGFANVVTEGLLAGLDTSTAGTEGDPVWLGTGGNLIYGLANKPYAPAHLVFIGIVTRKNANNGEIFVKVQNGFELNEIHDVDLKTTVPVNGHILGFDGTLWVNKTIAGWLGYTPANASGTTNYISKFTGSTTLGNSQIYDNGTNVGIGTTSPGYKLTVSGGIQATTFSVFGGPVQFQSYMELVGGNSFYFYSAGNTYASTISQNGQNLILNPDTNVGIGTFNPLGKLHIADDGPNALRIGDTQVSTIGETNDGGYPGMKIVPYNSNIHIGISSTNDNKINLWYAGNNYTYWQQTSTYSVISNYSTNALVFQVNGGNVGIGTTDPQYKLDVAQVIRSKYGSNEGGIYLGGTPAGVAYVAGAVRATPSPSYSYTGKLSFYTTTWGVGTDYGITEQMYIDVTGSDTKAATLVMLPWGGNVGIGTSTPSQKFVVSNGSSEVFKVYGGGEVVAGTNYIYAAYSGGTSFYAQGPASFRNGIHNDTNTYLKIDGGTSGFTYFSGNVGIGTTSPAFPLTVYHATNAAATFQTSGTGTGAGNGFYVGHTSNISYVWNYNNFPLVLATNNTERIRVTEGGNVGIGTTSPASKLEVRGAVTFFGDSSFQAGNLVLVDVASGGSTWGIYSGYPSLGDFTIRESGIDNRFVIKKTTGNVGIGTTTPNYKLHVSGNVYINETLFVNQLTTIEDSLIVYDNLGIGTTSPGYKLDVNGTGRFNTNGNALRLNSTSNDVWATFIPQTGNAWRWQARTTSQFSIYNESLGIFPFTIESSGAATFSSSVTAGGAISTSGTGLNASVRISNTTSSTGKDWHLYSLNNGNLGLYNNTDGLYAYQITPGGNVGIGTTSPVTGLDVRTSPYSNTTARFGTSRPVYIINDDPIIGFNQYYNSGWKSGTTGYSGNIGVSSSGEMYFNVSTASVATDNTVTQREVIRILNNGNVGIGTTSPATKLHIVSTSTTELRLENSDANNNHGFIKYETQNSSGGNLIIGTNASGGGYGALLFTANNNVDFVGGGDLRIVKSGNVGIGTYSPSGKLTVAAGASYGITASSSQRYLMQALNTSNSVNSAYGWWWFHDNNSNMGFHADGIGDILTLTRGGAMTLGGHTMWHAGNDGSGSGLDADTVDGLQASSLLRSDIYNSNYGGLQVFRNIGTIDGSWPDSDHTFSLENSDAGNIVLNFHRGGYTSNNLRYNGSSFRFDAALESTGVITATGGNSSNWNTAYGWGNHASAGYLTSYSETDTLASVTGRGASTSTAVTFNGGVNLAADTGIRKAGDNWIIGYSTSLPGIAIGSGTVTDKVSISSGGTQRVWFDTNGNVGIGTASPNYKLDVNGSINIYTGNSLRWGSGDAEIINSGWNLLFKTYNGSVLSEAMRINSAGKVSIGTTDTNSDKSDFTVYTGGTTTLALAGNLLRVGDTDVNWGVALRSNGVLETYGQNLYLGSAAGNYPVTINPNGTNSVSFYQSESYINTYTKINKNWGGGDYSSEAFTIRGTYPSIALRSTNANFKWLLHTDSAGNFRWYTGSDTDSNTWTNRFTFGTDNNFYVDYGHVYVSGGNSTQWNTAYSWGNHAGLYLPLTGGTMSGAITVNLGNVSSDTVAFKVGGPSNYDSLTIGMEDTPDYDAFIASYGNDIRFYSGKNVGTENHSFHWYTSKAGTAQHSQVAMLLDHNQNLTVTGGVYVSGGNSSNWNTAYGWGNHASQGYATTSYVTTQINNLINGAPGALDTLDELAAALGDDSNFATTVTNSIAGKVSKSGDTMTGNINWDTQNTGLTWNMNTDGAYIKFFNTGDGDTNSRLEYSTSDNGDEYHRWVIAGVEKMNLKWGGLTVTDTIYASGGNSSNWNTAYGWGNHASAGYALNSSLANYLPLSGGVIGGAVTINGNLTVNGTITENSSIKLKENVETSEGNLEKVVNLRPVTYNKIGSQTTELGLIAEEVAEVYPEFVQYDENGEPVGVHYSRLTAALIGAVKELTNQVQELNKKING